MFDIERLILPEFTTIAELSLLVRNLQTSIMWRQLLKCSFIELPRRIKILEIQKLYFTLYQPIYYNAPP